jgi:20S proteasome subunit beta 7
VKRLHRFNDRTVIGVGGDVSDMQYLDRLLNSLDIKENYSSYGHSLNAKTFTPTSPKSFTSGARISIHCGTRFWSPG